MGSGPFEDGALKWQSTRGPESALSMECRTAGPTGFEPVTSSLKGWRPSPLGDGPDASEVYARSGQGLLACRSEERRVGKECRL